MLHCDDDDLAVIALGEPASPEDDAHLQQCPRCRSRLDQWAAVVTAARTVDPQDEPVPPPAEVWNAITTELGLGTATPLADRRRQRSPWLLVAAAAAIGLVVGGGVTAAVVTSSSPSADVVARAALDPLGASGSTGTATVETGPDGPVLRVAMADLAPVEDGYYEVWMATADAGTMVAVGTLSPGQEARIALPSGMDVTAFPLVDVSVEHFDGDPGHSAESVARGQLAT